MKSVSYLSLNTFGGKLIEHFACSRVDAYSKVPSGVTHQQGPQNEHATSHLSCSNCGCNTTKHTNNAMEAQKHVKKPP